eukprot:5529449-Prorocentrum_lima.AAC.1
MSFLLAFVERRKCGIGRSCLLMKVANNCCYSRGNPGCELPCPQSGRMRPATFDGDMFASAIALQRSDVTNQSLV